MSKTGGLGDMVLLGPYDVSGDYQALGGISSPRGTFDSTGVNKSANERLLTTQDGAINATTFFNPGLEANALHNLAKTLPYTDVQFAYGRGTALGSPAAVCVSKQINYDPTMNQDKSLTFGINLQANSYGLEWGEQLTAGVRTDTAATNGTGVDFTAVSTVFGWQAYLWVTGITGTSVTVKLQDSADNAAWTDLSGGSFTAATAAGAQRIQGGRTDTVRRYVRAVSSGTFSSASFAAVFCRNQAAVAF